MRKSDPPQAPGPARAPLHGAVRLRAAVSHLSRRLRAALPAGAISVAKLSVLAHLHRGGPMCPTELARRERVKLQSLTRLLAELESDGWVLRQAHDGDGRQSLLSLTRLGIKALTADVHRREASLARAIASRLSEKEQTLLLAACELIDRVADAVSDEAGVAAGAGRAE